MELLFCEVEPLRLDASYAAATLIFSVLLGNMSFLYTIQLLVIQWVIYFFNFFFAKVSDFNTVTYFNKNFFSCGEQQTVQNK